MNKEYMSVMASTLTKQTGKFMVCRDKSGKCPLIDPSSLKKNNSVKIIINATK
jgi:hypothetical protein